MDSLRRSFDWLAFLTRVIVIAALATWLLVERLHRNDHLGMALVAVIGYVVLPALAYVQTRYYNSRFMFGIIDAVRRRIAGQRHER